MISSMQKLIAFVRGDCIFSLDVVVAKDVIRRFLEENIAK